VAGRSADPGFFAFLRMDEFPSRKTGPLLLTAHSILNNLGSREASISKKLVQLVLKKGKALA